jgi:hypothetical protein
MILADVTECRSVLIKYSGAFGNFSVRLPAGYSARAVAGLSEPYHFTVTVVTYTTTVVQMHLKDVNRRI